MRYPLPKTGMVLATAFAIGVALLVADLNDFNFSLFIFNALSVYVVVLWASHYWEDHMNSESERFEKKIDALHDKLLDMDSKLESLYDSQVPGVRDALGDVSKRLESLEFEVAKIRENM